MAALAVPALVVLAPAGALASARTPVPSPSPSTSVGVLPKSREYLRRGDSGAAVRKLQLRLRAHHPTHVVADGAFGALTQHAVAALERA